MYDWIWNPLATEYALSSDFDDRWRSGGSVDEICTEAHIDPESILARIEKFVKEREKRLGELRKGLGTA